MRAVHNHRLIFWRADFIDAKQGRWAGVDEYLKKPIDKEKLKQSILRFKKVSENYSKKELNFYAQKLLDVIKSQKTEN